MHLLKYEKGKLQTSTAHAISEEIGCKGGDIVTKNIIKSAAIALTALFKIILIWL